MLIFCFSIYFIVLLLIRINNINIQGCSLNKLCVAAYSTNSSELESCHIAGLFFYLIWSTLLCPVWRPQKIIYKLTINMTLKIISNYKYKTQTKIFSSWVSRQSYGKIGRASSLFWYSVAKNFFIAIKYLFDHIFTKMAS